MKLISNIFLTQVNNLSTEPIQRALLGKRMLIGAAIALTLILIFLLPVKNADPAWGELWMIRPIVVVSFAGAMGGVFYYFMDPLRKKGGYSKILANVLSVFVYIIGLWMGTVLGLDGTLWD